MRAYLEKIISGEDLSVQEMKEVAHHLFDEATDPVLVASFLVALKQKKEAVSEITGLAEVMRDYATRIPFHGTDVMDNCGTGGDRSQSFNISTTSAFVVAGAGITVSKHGNRSISSKTGSADVLEALGVNLNLSTSDTAHLLKENGIAFLFAQSMHPKMKPVAAVRQRLKLPTIFNIIGPLTNPVELNTQLVGIYRRDLLFDVAQALQLLGRKRALVINGAGYMDEASLMGDNHCVLLDDNELISFTIHPNDVGLEVCDNEDIKGGSKEENAKLLIHVLEGHPGPHRDTVLLNAGLAIFANGKAKTPTEGVELARESIDSGRALEKLNNMIQFSNERGGEDA